LKDINQDKALSPSSLYPLPCGCGSPGLLPAY
jgi:hypothetical protein